MASAEVRNAMIVAPWDPAEEEIDPLLYFGDVSGNQYAVSAITGELIWRKRMDDHGVATLTAASTLVDDVLYVPISSLEEGAAISADYPCCTFRGAVAALNAGSGEELWRRYFIPPAKEQATNSAGKKLYGPSGVPVWAGMSVDGDLLFVATGDDYTGEGSGASDSVIALNRHSGETAMYGMLLASMRARLIVRTTMAPTGTMELVLLWRSAPQGANDCLRVTKAVWLWV